MLDTDTSRRAVGLVLAVLMLVSAVGLAAGLSLDTETTNTTSTTGLGAGDTVTSLDNASQTKTIQVISTNATANADRTKFYVALENEETGRIFFTSKKNWTVVSGTNDHYSVTFNHSAMFTDLGRGADENVTVKAHIYWNKSAPDEEYVNFTFYAKNDNDTVVVPAVTGNTEAEQTGVSAFNMTLFGAADPATRTTENVTVDTANTTLIRVPVDNESTQAALSSVAEPNVDGTFVQTVYVTVAGEYVPVFMDDAGYKPWLNNDNETYATITDSGEYVMVHNAAQKLNDSTVKVTVSANEQINGAQYRQMLQTYDAEMTTVAMGFAVLDLNGDPFDNRTVPGVNTLESAASGNVTG